MALPVAVLEKAHVIRRELVGATSTEEAPDSAWNAAVQRRACEICSCEIVRDLEVHHIRPRAEAGATGQFADGARMNALRNLIVVCQRCHDRHHAGELEIGPVRQTSDGPVRELAQFAYRGGAEGSTGPAALSVPRIPVGVSEEQMEIVRERLRRFPNCPPARMQFDLEQLGIRIPLQRLRVLRGQL
jgi:hypothetical protein